MDVSIIIPFYGHWSLTHQRLMELQKHILDPIEIVLVDDCSQDDGMNRAIDWWIDNGKHKISCIHHDENLGFGKSMNHGVDHSSGDIVILLSNDVEVRGDFVSIIIDKLSKDGKMFIGGELHGWNTGWNVLPINEENKLFPYCAGWLLACKRATWNDIGGFDPIYGKFDYEDVDISTTALLKGYRLTPLDLKFMLRHFSGQTVRKMYPDREKYTLENRTRFIEKWSKILKND